MLRTHRESLFSFLGAEAMQPHDNPRSANPAMSEGEEAAASNNAPTSNSPQDEPPKPSRSQSLALSSLSSSRMLSPTRPNWPRRLSEVPRATHMEELIHARRASMRVLFPDSAVDEEEAADRATADSFNRKLNVEQNSEFVRRIQQAIKDNDQAVNEIYKSTAMEIRLKELTYQVPVMEEEQRKIHTIYNSSPLYKLQKAFKSMNTKKNKEEEWCNVLTSVNLVLKPQTMYLVLGPPSSGKTSLLKAIAGMLSAKDAKLSGKVLYNNLTVLGEGENTHKSLFQNLVAFVRQMDIHAARLTVNETFRFASHCKDSREKDEKERRVKMTLDALGIGHVMNTFVGDETVRGVSGGQRRRVTLGEMLVFDTPLLCGDEISTGLDTASTVDILSILSYITRLFQRVTVISLLQPSPEAVALFDEIVLLGDGGTILFSGPTEQARDYFLKLGYVQPDGMDDADYLLAVASSDRGLLYRPDERFDEDIVEEADTTEVLGVKFNKSGNSEIIKKALGKEWQCDWNIKGSDGNSIKAFEKKYQNSFLKSVWLNLKRAFVLWSRDRIFIRASAIKNLAMGLSVGAVFFQTNVNSSFFGVLFQGNLFIMLGAMTSAPEKLNDRAVFYKHDDSNFYPALSYVIGQALALVPQMIMDVLLFGTIVYWMVGFTSQAGGFFLYLALFFSFNFTMGQLFGLLASVASSKTVVQAGGAVILLLNTLFCGYLVCPVVIPPYYIWIYWCMPLAWVYRALLLNEYTASDYANGVGETILETWGFVYNEEAFTREWIGYCFAYLFPFVVLCVAAAAIGLQYYRAEPKKSTSDIPKSTELKKEDESSAKDDTFIPVNLTFNNLCYEVKSSVGNEHIQLLNNVSGMFSPGRMCALMGESGAGKTTLMDVIALRKQSGNITGDIFLNGFPQNDVSFRRCSGYVEQFDVQSAELTVRETIRFSAILRLDRSNPVFTVEDGLNKHVEKMIDMLELTNEADMLVGSAEEGGLTFEQKKRLSIAVELAASPSIVFLDEPTSGLDARAALLVMNALRKIASTGRTIVCTIHQPSSTVFDLFDDLLLLRKGGEVVFFGELGDCSCNLVQYFESLGATPMNKGENPATWMLNVLSEQIVIKAENGQEAPLDFAYAWSHSDHSRKLKAQLSEISNTRDEKLEIVYKTRFAASKWQRDNLMANRLVTIYWRSPAYNLNRMLLSLFIALLISSVFIPIRANTVFTEAQMSSLLSCIFISFIIIGVLSITSVLPVMLSIRDIFYRHKAAGALGYGSVARALATAEKRFILISSTLFCLVFVPVSGIVISTDEFKERVGQGFAFWGFFTFNMAIYSYIGQLFMCLVRGPATAQILCSIFIGINNFFSGLIVRPQQMVGGFWAITYWINPGHFVYEGLVMSVFFNDVREVIVGQGSDYYDELNCDNIAVDGECKVSVSAYVDAFFGGQYSRDNVVRNAVILGAILLVVRASTFLALAKLTYSGK